MLLVHRETRGSRDVHIEIHDPDATVADLCHTLEPDAPITALRIDGRIVSASTPLDRAGIGTGSIVERIPHDGAPDDIPSSLFADRAAGAEPPAVPTMAIEVVSGSDTGRRHVLPDGEHLLGRAADDRLGGLRVDDPSVARRQALVIRSGTSVTIRDLGATNPTLLAGVPVREVQVWPPGAIVTVGRSRLRLTTAEPPSAGRDPIEGPPPWTLHRTPEPTPPDPPEPLAVPDEPDQLPAVTPIGVAAIIGSLVLAAVLVTVLGNWMYALFAGFGPILALLSSIDSRRRRKVQHRRNSSRRRSDLDRFETELLRRRDADRRQLAGRLTSAAEAVVLASGGPGGREPHLACWRRRSDHPDAHVVRLGRGALPWRPSLTVDPARLPADVRTLVDNMATIPAAPIPLPLEPGRPIALVGPPELCRRIARSLLVQAAVLHGPADLEVAVIAGDERADRWAWALWLPHTVGPGGAAMVGLQIADRERIADLLLPDDDEETSGPNRLVVIDDPAGLAGRRDPARTMLRLGLDEANRIVPVVLVDGGPIPAGCVTVRVESSGAARLGDGSVLSVDGLAVDTAAAAARSLARALDPEVDDTARHLPGLVELSDLVGAERLEPDAIGARWRAAGTDPPPTAVIGVGVDGPITIDLTHDGPHGLVAGTTGAGKSELLRSLIVSLALGSSPDHLCFVLIDFKGGSAFDACALLPHTIGTVTDLDDHLADRALQCLEAELRHREERLRAAGAADITEMRRILVPEVDEPLPRLVVVIDEFATLAAELPDFVDALVGIAQRGRSLGVHLVLATQRPTGAVNDNIRANTALRIALRVHDRADSDDVVGVPDAATLPRNRPGRAVVRLGPSEVMTVQTAYAGAAGLTAPRDPVAVRSLGAPDPAAAVDGSAGGPTDLEVLVDRLAESWQRLGGRRPRDVWPDPLPEVLPGPLPDPTPHPDALLLGVADDPVRQRHRPYAWQLDGPMLAIGLPGSGVSTALAGVVLAAARRWSSDELHVHVLDCAHGGLTALAGLPQVGAVVHEHEEERQRRLLERLSRELTVAGPRRLLVLDGLGSFHDRWGDRLDGPWVQLTELVRRGSAVGIHVALGAEGAGRVPHQILTACRQRLLFRLSDRSDFANFGVPPSAIPDLPVERAVDPDGPTVVQIARPGRGLGAEVAALAGTAIGGTGPPPRPVGVLPGALELGMLCGADRPAAHLDPSGALTLLVGVSDHDLAFARLALPPSAHALIAGPPRSGRTTALATIAAAATTTDRPVLWLGTADDAPPGTHPASADDVLELADELDPVLIAVDDGEDLADHPDLGALVDERRPGRHLVVSARSDRLRGAWNSWLREVRSDRIGILLDPDRDLDGDLLGVRLPRELPVTPRTGLGWLVGEPNGYAQIALPILS